MLLRAVRLHHPHASPRAARDERDLFAVRGPGGVQRRVVAPWREELPLAGPARANDIDAGLGEAAAAHERDQPVAVRATCRASRGRARAARRSDEYDE